MAKGTGLIGNFKGKVGNTVGYKLAASNNGQTQGIRVYQPIVKNPKTAAQAEQRAKLLAVNATYRALKMVIDRGNEGLPYGNKSRLAWLKGALKATQMPWFEKGAVVDAAVVCQLTKGSLAGVRYTVDDSSINISVPGASREATYGTIGAVSTALIGAYPSLKEGDQMTFVYLSHKDGALQSVVESIIINPTSTAVTTKFQANDNRIDVLFDLTGGVGAVIISREGVNGEHLRSTASLVIYEDYETQAPYDADSKAAAIASYQASAANNTDWAEESIQ